MNATRHAARIPDTIDSKMTRSLLFEPSVVSTVSVGSPWRLRDNFTSSVLRVVMKTMSFDFLSKHKIKAKTDIRFDGLTAEFPLHPKLHYSSQNALEHR